MVYILIFGGIFVIFIVFLIFILSDRYGWKKILLVFLFGLLVKSGFCFMNIIMNYDVNFFIIYFFIEGCIGGWVFFVVICFFGFVDIMKVGK